MASTILIFFVALLAGMESVLDAWEFHQPILAATLIGIVTGHPVEGLMLGGQLQLITLGWMNVGAAMAPDTALASVASAILVTGPAHLSVAEGIAIAIPLAIAGQVLTIFVRTLLVSFSHMADAFAKQGRSRPIEILHFTGLLIQGLRVAIPAMLILALPAQAIINAINSIPTVITGGLQVAGGFIVIVGYAMVVNMMASPSLWPFLFLGFALSALTDLNLAAMGIIGAALALIMTQLTRYDRMPSAQTDEALLEEEADAVDTHLLTKKDQIMTFLRQGFILASFNYERMQNMGVAYIMMPTLRRLYPNNRAEMAAGLVRQLEFFNTHPYLASPIIGVTMAMEEQRAKGAPIDDATISSVKVGMMGPVAGVGDPLFWGTLRPVLGALAASFAIQGSLIGPIIFFFGWNIIRLATLWYGQKFGYEQGTNIASNLGDGLMQKVTQGASTMGMFMMGVLVPRWTTMNFPLVISKITNDPKKVIDVEKINEQIANHSLSGQDILNVSRQLMDGKVFNHFQITTLGNLFNQLIPGLMPLAALFAVLWLLRKNISPILIIFGIFVIGIAGFALGIFGV
ncbi:mannose/fructose/sorbose family PTS transporter subunit IIC [Weissella halotolerans]|uniref:PTS system mannose fructose sorbose family IID component n=1 Tax=Weissella halotolerans DSM 20190 TaxID=1123500 RepID=A0A0R2G5J1_9LACO|nr:PTS system mannose fructose sorbose family IID component [Weissella halotolerans DSM 20190]